MTPPDTQQRAVDRVLNSGDPTIGRYKVSAQPDETIDIECYGTDDYLVKRVTVFRNGVTTEDPS